MCVKERRRRHLCRREGEEAYVCRRNDEDTCVQGIGKGDMCAGERRRRHVCRREEEETRVQERDGGKAFIGRLPGKQVCGVAPNVAMYIARSDYILGGLHLTNPAFLPLALLKVVLWCHPGQHSATGAVGHREARLRWDDQPALPAGHVYSRHGQGAGAPLQDGGQEVLPEEL